MARDYEHDAVVCNRIAYSPRRYAQTIVSVGYCAGYLTVGDRMPKGYIHNSMTHPLSEVGGAQRNRWPKIGGIAAKIEVEPMSRLLKHGQIGALGVLRAERLGKVPLAIEPQSHKGLAIAGHGDAA